MVEYFFKLFYVYCLQNDLLNVEFVFDFRKGDITKIAFNQSYHLCKIAIQLGAILPDFCDLKLSNLPVVLVSGFNDG